MNRRLSLLLVLLMTLTAASCTMREAHNPSQADPTAAPTPAGALSGVTVLIDPGHGGYDGGARCADSGLWEKELNLRMALVIEQALTARGARVVMTRRTDVDLCDEQTAGIAKKRQDLQRRVDMAAANGADLLLSIHMNEYRARNESGPQVFYRKGCEGGRLLAGCLQAALIHTLQPRRERAAMAGDYYVLQLELPSVLVECGFISNPQEEKLLLNEQYQQLTALAVADGVTDYLRLSGRINPPG